MIVVGQNNKKSVETHRETLIVNPGEGCGWVKGEATLAIVEMSRKSCLFHTI